MSPSVFQSAKLALVSFTGLGKDALHIHVGLGVFFSAALLFRCSIKSYKPLLVLLLVASLGELLDLAHDFGGRGVLRWGASIHDLVNTLFWPGIFFLMARFTHLSDYLLDRLRK